VCPPHRTSSPPRYHSRSGEKGQSKQPEVNRSLLRTAPAANAAPCFHRRNPNAVKKTLCSRSGCIRSGVPPPTGKTPTTPAKRQGNVQLDLEATPAPLLRHLRSATPAERARDRAGKEERSHIVPFELFIPTQ
jgi:hypothetical protein